MRRNSYLVKTTLAMAMGLSLQSCGWVDSTGRQGNSGPVAKITSSDESVTYSDSSQPDANTPLQTQERSSGIVLSASGSKDPDGAQSTLSYQWQVTSENKAVIKQLTEEELTAAQIEFDTDSIYATQDVVFQLTVTDKDGAQKSTQATVRVGNLPPVANSDTNALYMVNEGATLSIAASNGVLVNDGDEFEKKNVLFGAKLNSDATNGTVTLNQDGSFTYQSNGAEVVADEFSYVATDGDADSAPVTVKLVISPVNDRPVATAHTYSVAEGAALNVNAAQGLRSGATDAEDGIGRLIVPNDGITVPPQHGILSWNADGSFTYTHDGGAATVDTFNYVIKDDDGALSDPQTVTINVTAQNDLPTTLPASINVTEGGTVELLHTALFDKVNDEETADNELIFSYTGSATTPHGSVSFVNNKYVYVHNDDGTAQSEADTDTFNYSVQDVAGGPISTGTVTVTIANVNDAPVSQNFNANASKGIASNITVLSNDANVAGAFDNDTLPANRTSDIAAVIIVTGPTNGTASVNGDNTIAYTSNVGAHTSDTITYKVRDAAGLESATSTINITVDDAANNAPVANNTCELNGINAQREAAITIDLSTLASDTDSDPLTYSLLGSNTYTKGTASISGSTVTYTPSVGVTPGVETFSYQVDDGRSGITTGEIKVIIRKRIMPLGDSITFGKTGGYNAEGIDGPANPAAIGYRKHLFDQLNTNKYGVDFVGGLSAGTSAGLADANHEGHNGFTINDLDAGTASYLAANPAEIVLLHIGSNDFDLTGAGAVSAAGIQSIIGKVTAANGSAETLVAQIIQRRTTSADISTFNSAIAATTGTRTIVNMETVLTSPTDYADEVHPNQAGYNKIANAWFSAITSKLDKCP